MRDQKLLYAVYVFGILVWLGKEKEKEVEGLQSVTAHGCADAWMHKASTCTHLRKTLASLRSKKITGCTDQGSIWVTSRSEVGCSFGTSKDCLTRSWEDPMRLSAAVIAPHLAASLSIPPFLRGRRGICLIFPKKNIRGWFFDEEDMREKHIDPGSIADERKVTERNWSG